MNSTRKVIVKFHGTGVDNVIITYNIRPRSKFITEITEEFDALKVQDICETINVQIVADFVTITLYKQEIQILLSAENWYHYMLYSISGLMICTSIFNRS